MLHVVHSCMLKKKIKKMFRCDFIFIPALLTTSLQQLMSILDKIATQRRQDVALAKTKTTLQTLQSLITELDTRQSPPLNLHTIIQQGSIGNPQISLAAEFKRASPSKGDIATDLDITTQITTYANAGASIVSVLTEPKWFKGSLKDLQAARLAVEIQANTNATLQTASAPTQQPRRVAVLRKDFIVDEYQIYEARAYGADTLLLIVAILSDSELTSLILKARELGMEPLVEVNSVSELTRALLCNAMVIGVNNRNLHTFQVDLETTSRVANAITTQHLTNQKGEVRKKKLEIYTER